MALLAQARRCWLKLAKLSSLLNIPYQMIICVCVYCIQWLTCVYACECVCVCEREKEGVCGHCQHRRACAGRAVQQELVYAIHIHCICIYTYNHLAW